MCCIFKTIFIKHENTKNYTLNCAYNVLKYKKLYIKLYLKFPLVNVCL